MSGTRQEAFEWVKPEPQAVAGPGMPAPRSQAWEAALAAGVPAPGAIVAGAAQRCGRTSLEVEEALREAGVMLSSPLAASRTLRLRRVCVEGIKPGGEVLSWEQRFAPGVWALTHGRNSAGKTSCLEFGVWALRGSPRDLPADVQDWVHRLEVDAVVGTRALRIVLEGLASARPQCTISCAPSEQALEMPTDAGFALVGQVTGAGEASRLIDQVMRRELGLDSTVLWDRSGGRDGEGSTQTHGWSSYFGALYLNPGGTNLLLGDVATGGLPGRLLELFVDVPYSSTLSQVQVVIKQHAKVQRQALRRAQGDAQARSAERKQWERELKALRARAKELREKDAALLMVQALAAVDTAGQEYRSAHARAAGAKAALELAKDERIAAQQRLMDAEETDRARRVLGLTESVCCGRCEQAFEPERKAAERRDGTCQSCTRQLPVIDEDRTQVLLDELNERFQAAKAAEASAKAASAAAEGGQKRAHLVHEQAQVRLKKTESASQVHSAVLKAEVGAGILQGKLEATSPVPDGPAVGGGVQILEAVCDELLACVQRVSTQLFADLDGEIVALSTRFGVENLDAVRLQRNAVVNAVKAGVRTRFGDLSRGDRLRMRIATVIALLRVGARRGAATHPGLLFIDSIGAEELTLDAGRTLVRELDQVARELGGLQVVLTTAEPRMVHGLLPAAQVVTSTGRHLF